MSISQLKNTVLTLKVGRQYLWCNTQIDDLVSLVDGDVKDKLWMRIYIGSRMWKGIDVEGGALDTVRLLKNNLTDIKHEIETKHRRELVNKAQLIKPSGNALYTLLQEYAKACLAFLNDSGVEVSRESEDSIFSGFTRHLQKYCGLSFDEIKTVLLNNEINNYDTDNIPLDIIALEDLDVSLQGMVAAIENLYARCIDVPDKTVGVR